MAELPYGLLAWALLPGPAAVLDAVRDRARRGFATESGTLRLVLTPDGRREVSRLLGTAWSASGRPVSLRRLAQALAEDGLTVRAFVEAVDGRPLVDERAARRAARDAAEREHREVLAVLDGTGIDLDAARAWAQDTGLPRPGDGRLLSLTTAVAQVWQQLPWVTDRGVRLATLAADVLDDAHGLDYDRLLGRAVCRLVALHRGLPRPLGRGRDWRRAWAAGGVLCDEVSSRVLVLNLPLSGLAPAAALCSAIPGEPVWLTLRSLAGDWTIPRGTVVHVCENPTVVEAAADRLGAGCSPLVCTDGVPSFAALDLVEGLARAGARLHVRADIDDNGFVTVDQLRAVAPDAELWRFDEADYVRRLGSTPATDSDGEADDVVRRLGRLRRRFQRHNATVHEESLLSELLDDLAAAAARSRRDASAPGTADGSADT